MNLLKPWVVRVLDGGARPSYVYFWTRKSALKWMEELRFMHPAMVLMSAGSARRARIRDRRT